jgi:hypothetical protein
MLLGLVLVALHDLAQRQQRVVHLQRVGVLQVFEKGGDERGPSVRKKEGEVMVSGEW